ADDRDPMVVDANRVADRRWIAAEMRLPKRVAQHDVRMRELAVVVTRLEEAADGRPQTEHRKEIRRDILDHYALRAMAAAHVYLVERVRRELAEHRRVAPEIEVVRIRHLVRRGERGIALGEDDELLTVR